MRNKRKINTFHVFYRISDNGFKSKIKPSYITKINCLENALTTFVNKECKFHIFVDSIVDDTDKKMRLLCDKFEGISIEYLNCGGNSKSFRKILDYACQLNDDDFVYFLEDDYLHLQDSFDVLKDAAYWNYTDYITLYDHPNKYDNSECPINEKCRIFGEKTMLFKTSIHHWKITNSTTMTFGAFADVLKRDRDVFMKYTNDIYPYDYKIFKELESNNKLLSSPIPSLSTHGETKLLAPFIDWYDVVNNTQTCCITIISHKETLSGNDEKSYLRALNVFNNRDIKIVIPDNISTDYYDKFKEKFKFEYVKVKPTWLDSVKSYSKMCCSKEFYELFKDYDYMLIYQTDCWVFEDKLDEFMKLEYDYYGAPWPHHRDTVGNGGFSLRKISKMIEVTSKYEYKGDSLLGNEDTWFCQTHKDDLSICDLNTACNFSIEFLTKNYLSKIISHPMGLHGKKMIPLWDDNGNKFMGLKK